MSTVLISTAPARGHLYPMMDVALAPRESGHRAVVQMLADERPNLTAAGVEHRAIDPAIESIELLNALRAELGVAPLAGQPDLYLRSDALLFRTTEPFEYPHRDWHSTVHLIGPGLWPPPADPPEWLAELPHPRVLLSVSAQLQQDGAIIEAALRGLADDPGSIIVTTAALDPESFTAPHDRTRIARSSRTPRSWTTSTSS